MLTKNNISEYNNKYYIIDDGWSVVYLYVREAEGYDYEDFGDIIATADTLEQHRTLIFKGVKSLLDNAISGQNADDLKKSRKELDTYLIEKNK